MTDLSQTRVSPVSVPAPVSDRRGLWVAVGLWALACFSGLVFRPLLPLDETRYTAVAWEMHHDGQWLVPHLNGHPYHHKPPLLFWLMNLGWQVTGVSEVWARLVAPLLGLLAVGLTYRMARVLWPDRLQVAVMAPVILIGCVLFALFSSLVFFDLPLTASVLLAWLGVLRAAAGKGSTGWGLMGVAMGVGILFKGPVALLHAALPALLAPLWIPRRPRSWGRWYGGLGLAVLVAAAISLAWAIPAARAGGPEFSRMLFFGQHAGRVVGSFQHAKPLWWYLVILPVMLFPWTAWGASWRAWAAYPHCRHEPGMRFIVPTFVVALLIFSLISGKQPQYLLPLFPLASLALARLLDGHRFVDRRVDRLIPGALAVIAGLGLMAARPAAPWIDAQGWIKTPVSEVLDGLHPVWGALLVAAGVFFLWDRSRSLRLRVATVAAMPMAVLVFAQGSFFGSEYRKYDQTPTAVQVSAAQKAGRPVAILGGYEGQFTFLGRLTAPVVSLTETSARAWLEAHPDALVVAIHRRRPDPTLPVAPEFVYPHRGRNCFGWRAADLLSLGDAYLRDVPREAVPRG